MLQKKKNAALEATSVCQAGWEKCASTNLTQQRELQSPEEQGQTFYPVVLKIMS